MSVNLYQWGEIIMSDNNTIQIPESMTKEEAEKAIKDLYERKLVKKRRWDSEYLNKDGNGIPREFYEEIYTSIQKWIAPKDISAADHLWDAIRCIMNFRKWYSI